MHEGKTTEEGLYYLSDIVREPCRVCLALVNVRAEFSFKLRFAPRYESWGLWSCFPNSQPNSNSGSWRDGLSIVLYRTHGLRFQNTQHKNMHPEQSTTVSVEYFLYKYDSLNANSE